MSAPSLVEKLIRSPESLTWRDVLSGWREKHTRKDADYAMIAGTTLDSAQTEMSMLQKWQRPWLFFRVFCGGMSAFAVLLASVMAVIASQGACVNPCLNLLMFLLPPCVVPVTLMILFWEMNAPRNISLAELIVYFFTGGVLSLMVSLLLFPLVPGYEASWAPVAEEPGKLLIAMFFLRRLHRKKGRVFGLNGLVIGAAVGAGFAAFESAQYAYDAYLNAILQMNISYDELLLHGVSIILVLETLLPVLVSIVLRGVCAVCCHVLYCAPYSCIAALHIKGGNPFAALRHMDFWAVFLLSVLVHALWNAPFGGLLLKLPAATALLWLSCRYGVRKSFGQLSACVATAGQGAPNALRVQCVAGVHAGVAFALTKPEILIGSDADCLLSYPVSTPGISGRHCKLLVRQGQLYLADMGSHAGTYLNGARLRPGTGYPLKAGDSFALGSDEQAFTVV